MIFLASDFFTHSKGIYYCKIHFPLEETANCLGIFFSWIIFCHISTQFLVLGQKKFSFLQFQQFSTNLLPLNVNFFFMIMNDATSEN
jgi:hypothetical protein